MAKRYYFGGNYFSEQDVLDQATADGISVSSYLKQHPEIREESVQPTKQPLNLSINPDTGKEYEVEISRLIQVFNNNIWNNKKSVK